MQQVLLYDRTHVPANWTELIRAGQYAVFLSDIESSAPVSSDGSPVNSASEYFCLIFDSLSDAESYCQEAVKKVRRPIWWDGFCSAWSWACSAEQGIQRVEHKIRWAQ